MGNIRIDKYLWAVRIYKTRNFSTEECKKGHIFVNGNEIKPSKVVNINDIIEIKFQNIIRKFTVLDVIENRVSATLAKNAILETTSAEELEKLKLIKINNLMFPERPTKKNRRLIENFLNNKDL
ncbi:MAG: RNA-binding S4 domain-containing protein [Bacteroidales bacterium]|nr:RNA-binding S4 domain-containing protein [Bacteroidales bacterium]